MNTPFLCFKLSGHLHTTLRLCIWSTWYDTPCDGPHVQAVYTALKETEQRATDLFPYWKVGQSLQVQ
jgi:hypothetical protein